jgi:hypothetical protein
LRSPWISSSTPRGGKRLRRDRIKNKSKEEGIYIYCIVSSGENTSFGDIGLEENPVYTIPYKDISAVVHQCFAEPYETDEEERAKDWILTHQYIIDLATEHFDTVIPLRFDTIFRGNDATVVNWLREEYKHLKETLLKLKGKAEYGVNVYIEKNYIQKMVEDNKEIAALKRSLEGRPKGSAYLLRKRIEKIVKTQKDVEICILANKLYKRIAELVDELRLEQNVRDLPEKWKESVMILNLSCLVQKQRLKAIGDLLGEINRKHGFTVRFTGPWPPYSFVSLGETGGNRQDLKT